MTSIAILRTVLPTLARIPRARLPWWCILSASVLFVFALVICPGFSYAETASQNVKDEAFHSEGHGFSCLSTAFFSDASSPSDGSIPDSSATDVPSVQSTEEAPVCDKRQTAEASVRAGCTQESSVIQPGSIPILNNAHNEHCSSDEKATSPQVTNDFLDALKTVRMYSVKQNSLTDEEQAALRAAMDILSPLNGPMAFNITRDLSGEELEDALQGIAVYSRLEEALGSQAMLPAIGIGFILDYLRNSLKIPSDIYKHALSLCALLIPRNERIVEPMAKAMGCGKSTIYKGSDHLKETGFASYEAHGNAPGAGRKSVTQSFAEDIYDECTAAQVDEAKLREIRNKRIASEISGNLDADCQSFTEMETGTDTSADASASENTDDSTANEDVVALKKVTESFSPFDVMGWKIAELRNVIPDLTERIDFFGLRTTHGNVGTELLALSKLMRTSLETIEERYHELRALDYEYLFFPVLSDEDRQICETRAAELACEMEYLPYLANVLSATVCKIEQACRSVATVLSGLNDSVTAWYGGRQIQKAVSLKRLSREMKDIWLDYATIQDIAAEPVKNSCTSQNDETAEQNGLDLLLIFKHYKEAMEQLSDLEGRIEEQMIVENDLENANFCLALTQLATIKKGLERVVEGLLMNNKAPSVSAALSIIVETCRMSVSNWIRIWDECSTRHSALMKVSLLPLNHHFTETVNRLYEDLQFAVEHSNPARNSEQPQKADESNTSVDPALIQYNKECLEAVKKEAWSRIQEVRTHFQNLKENLTVGARSKKENKRSKADHIQDSIDLLDTLCVEFNGYVEGLQGSNNPNAWRGMVTAAYSLESMLQGWVNQWERTEDGFSVSFATSRKVSESILRPKHAKNVKKIWSLFEYESMPDSNGADAFITVDNVDDTDAWFQSSARLDPAKRLELIRLFVSQGLDPTDIKVWIDYIVGAESSRTYIDPTSKTKCCSVKKQELANALAFLTGISYSPNALWRILKEDMHYIGRQCAKLDQIGKPSEYRQQQFDYINAKLKSVNKKKTCILSVDTKAFVLLGRLKHDNGVLLCSPDGRVFRVYDHDYGFLLKDIYSKPNKYVGLDRMNEKAVLRPIGAWCINDESGYVSAVIGKDTADAMCNLIERVFVLKRQEMPELNSILILADGGGANMANGIAWLESLLNLSKKLNVQIEVCHYPPGCSRHNPIEGRLWSPISIHWKGKPFLDIEYVLRYMSETRTGKNRRNVTCWFDPNKYLTNEQKKAAGQPVLTRKELEKKADGRISYPFDEGTDMHKWNYVIEPAAVVTAAAA